MASTLEGIAEEVLMKGVGTKEVYLLLIAISLKRIADIQQEQLRIQKELLTDV